ncbi:MAG: hypothetical protein A2021_04495 [Elusimicrobia bacterium GWF2_52_66]|nr:MAG: hypothetical protein A2X33_08460 [Elusimicrobia bacterium GWA2_51_34]OGR86271.1 MAG: hypothetical protein A2021_04495 [Elusimicrobia bacterium GWF2_52_66]HAF95273.1 hypothetical protein [Elusimicrobiota bacterium]HCE97351.1 hypothetical protein [Elusimicrobiota bacterium]
MGIYLDNSAAAPVACSKTPGRNSVIVYLMNLGNKSWGNKTKQAFCLLMLLLLLRASCHSEAVPYLESINSESDFTSLAAPSFLATSQDLPMVMLVLDRADGAVYYINTAVYPLHSDFINAQYLSFDKGTDFDRENNRGRETGRFLMGFLVKRKNCYTLEFWSDNSVTSELIRELYSAVKAAFFGACLEFNPLSQGQLLPIAEVPFFKLYIDEILPRYQLISEGVSYGKVVISERLRGHSKGVIHIRKDSPKSLKPDLAGFVTSQPGDLSHACILARSLNLPAFHMPDAENYFRRFEGRHIRFEVRHGTFSVTPGSPMKTYQFVTERSSRRKRTLYADFEWKKLTELKDQLASDIPRFGAKSANLGQVVNFGIPGIEIPLGFTIPFYYYGQFIRENGLGTYISALLEDRDLYRDRILRKERLAGLRKRIQAGKINPVLAEAVRAKLAGDFAGKGVFVRSSTNSEDMPNFTGAGLYTTVPNMRDA